jgi:peptidyl-tRNA hydrolase
MPDMSHKMVFVVDTSLHMGIGKIASQVAHAGVGLYRLMISSGQRLEDMVMIWQEMG